VDVAPSDEPAATALSAALAELYAVTPDEFVATRTRLVQEAKAAGDVALAKALGRARRPTVAAWAVNAVVREHPDQAERLQELGDRLRAAQAQLDVAAMTELRKERDHLLGTWADDADAAGRRAGRPLSAAVGQEVRATLIAALAGEEATQAVLSGQLTRALTYSGFGAVDLSEAVVRTSSGAVLTVLPGQARPPTTKKPTQKKPTQKKSARKAEPEAEAETEVETETEPDAEEEAEAAERRRRVEEARAAHAAATEAAHEAALALDSARDRADETRWRVEDLEGQLRRARAEHRDAEQAATAAARARRAAAVEVASAERALRDAEAGHE